MARETALTQEQINAAADAIRADGGKPTARAVRERIGSGSMATILKFFQIWQGSQIKPVEQAITLPPALQRALVDYIGQEIASAKAGIEAELVTAQTAQHDLIIESERQASTIELQAQALETSQAAQAEQAGRMAQIDSDLTRATDDAGTPGNYGTGPCPGEAVGHEGEVGHEDDKGRIMSLTPATEAKAHALDAAIRSQPGRNSVSVLLAMLTSQNKDEREQAKRAVRDMVKIGTDILTAEQAAQDLADFANRNEP